MSPEDTINKFNIVTNFKDLEETLLEFVSELGFYNVVAGYRKNKRQFNSESNEGKVASTAGSPS